jgi:hypothetical protein
MTAAFVIIPFANSSKLKLTPRNHTPDMLQIDRPPLPKESRLISLQQPGNHTLCDHPVCQLQQAEADAPKSHAGYATDRPPDSPEEESLGFTATDDWQSLLHSSGLTTSASQGHRPQIAHQRKIQLAGSQWNSSVTLPTSLP